MPASLRNPCAPRRGNAAKVILITLGITFFIFLLACMGLGVAGYFWFKKNFGQALVSDPQEINKMLTEMTDVTIPPEFTPYRGSALFGMKQVTYKWCPTGDCPTIAPELENENIEIAAEDLDEDFGLGELTFMQFIHEDAQPGAAVTIQNVDDEFSDDILSETYASFEKTVHEFTIRGQVCKFCIIRGVQRDWSVEDEGAEEAEEMAADTADALTPPAAAESTDAPASEPAAATPEATAPAESPTTPEPAPADATTPESAPETSPAPIDAEVAPEATTGRKVVAVTGRFPGKQAEMSLNYVVAPEDFDEAKILELLKSIR